MISLLSLQITYATTSACDENGTCSYGLTDQERAQIDTEIAEKQKQMQLLQIETNKLKRLSDEGALIIVDTRNKLECMKARRKITILHPQNFYELIDLCENLDQQKPVVSILLLNNKIIVKNQMNVDDEVVKFKMIIDSMPDSKDIIKSIVETPPFLILSAMGSVWMHELGHKNEAEKNAHVSANIEMGFLSGTTYYSKEAANLDDNRRAKMAMAGIRMSDSLYRAFAQIIQQTSRNKNKITVYEQLMAFFQLVAGTDFIQYAGRHAVENYGKMGHKFSNDIEQFSKYSGISKEKIYAGAIWDLLSKISALWYYFKIGIGIPSEYPTCELLEYKSKNFSIKPELFFNSFTDTEYDASIIYGFTVKW